MTRWPLAAWLLPLVGCATAAPAPRGAPAEDIVPAAERPIPYPVVPPPEFQQAIEAGTRTATGRPGPRYWQNWADYRIHSRVLPDLKRLEGSASILYHNRSPHSLRVLVVDLAQNLHATGAVRGEEVEVTGGVDLQRVSVRGETLRTGVTEAPGYVVDGTKLIILPERPVPPGETVELGLEWAFTMPQAGAGARMGYDEGLLYLAYWYPQMAVFDEVVGWHPDQFLGTAEFYAGFGNYAVTLEVPAGWLVMGTGELTNADQVLAPPVLDRLRLAERSDSVVRVVTAGAPGPVTRGRPDELLRWSFRADSVRDVAYSITRGATWDVTRAAVGDRDGDGDMDHTRIGAIYRQPAFRWAEVARYERHAIRFLSEYTGYPYPWSHMTAVEGGGIIGGGMEYPMMTLIGDYTQAGDSALYYVTAHELAHMWIPMIVGTDERRYGWIDEGFTTFGENIARLDFFPGSEPFATDRETYLRVALAGQEGEMMRRSDYHYPGPAYGVASYAKPATVLNALRGLLGDEVFHRAYREFIDRWAFKHPYPWDLWNTFEDVSGRDLDWFWRSWYYETWLLDQAVQAVRPTPQGTEIVVADLGNVPMPARLLITRATGETLRREVPVEAWLQGARTATVVVPEDSPIVRVEIDPETVFPDADRANNVWVR